MRAYVFIYMIVVFVGSFSSVCQAESGMKIESGLIRIIEDPLSEFQIGSLLDESASLWRRNQQQVPSFGFSDKTYWLTFSLPLSSEHRILEVDYGLLDDITFYRVNPLGIAETISTGDALSFAERPIKHRAFLFELPPTSEPSQIVLRVKSSSSIQLPMAIWPRNQFFEQDQYRLAEHGIYYGIVLVMVLYNVFLFLRLKDLSYAYYVIYIVTFAITQATITGFSYQFVWSDSPLWNEQSIAVLTPLVVISGLIFVSNFLKLKSMHTKLYWFICGQIITACLLVVAGLVLPYAVVIKYVASLAIFSCTSILLTSYYITYKKAHQYALYFSAAWSVFLMGTVVLAMNKFGVLPRVALTESAAQIGSAIEIILLSFALAERFNEANSRRLRAEQLTLQTNMNLLKMEQEQNEKLELRVSERTNELAAALMEVSQLNEELSDLSSKDQLTGLRNRRYFDEMLEREFRRAKRNRTSLSLIMIDLDHFKKINDTYGHMAGDLCLKLVAAEVYRLVKRPPDLACRFGGEELSVILPETSSRGAVGLASDIRKAIAAITVTIDSYEFTVSASLGVSSVIPEEGFLFSQLLKQADKALYAAKENGRNTVEYYDFMAHPDHSVL